MEASENTGFSPLGGGGSQVRRIDPDRVRALLQGSASGSGYARLALMLETVFPRLAQSGRENRAG